MNTAPSPRRWPVAFRLGLFFAAAWCGVARVNAQTILSGTYSGTPITGSLFVMPYSTSATLTGGANFANAADLVLGRYAYLNWNQDATLSGINAYFGSGGYYANLPVGGSNTLTIDPTTRIAGGFEIYGGAVVNQGNLTANGYSTGNVSASTFINQGTLTASGPYSEIYVTNLINQGTINARNGGSVYLGSSATSNLGNVVISGGGRVYLSNDSTFDNTNATLTAPTGGSYQLYYGTIIGGTIAAGALTFYYGGILSGVTYTGDLSLASNTDVAFTNGTAFTGTNAALGNYSTLKWYQNGTLAGKIITAGTSGSGYASIEVGSGNSLTLDSATTLSGSFRIYGYNGATVVNQGTINNTSNGSYSYLYAPTFTNAGTITATAGTLRLGSSSSGYNTTNTGTVTADGSSTSIYVDGNFDNNGTLTAQNGSSLYFEGANTTANLGNVVLSGGGRAYFYYNTLDNTSATLTAPTGGSYELYGGTITGGTIAAGALAFLYGGTLDNATYNGDLTLTGGTSVTLANGATFTGANATVDASTLYLDQNGSLAGKTLTAQNSGSVYYQDVTTANLPSLVLASGGRAYLYGTLNNTSATLTAPTGGSYELYGGTISGGTIAAGALAFLYGGTLDNATYTGDLTLTGGTSVTFANGATFTGANATVDASTLNLNQNGSLAGKIITVQNGGSLYYQGSTTTANLGSAVFATGGGHVYLGGTLDNTLATLSVPTGGSYELYGGTITGGTIAAGALTFTSYNYSDYYNSHAGGTLSGVAYLGDLTLPAVTSVTFSNGTTFTGLNATLNSGGWLNWQQTGTLSAKTITTNSGTIYVTGTNSSLTLDSDTNVTGTVKIYSDGSSGTAITNQGTIAHTSGSGSIYARNFTNSGSISANGGSLVLGSTNSSYFSTNSGSVTANGSGTAIYLDGNFDNNGTLTANSGSLYFRGANTTANLGNVVISGGGRAYFSYNTLDNTSATLSAPTGGSYELYGGTITGGTIAAGALTFTTELGTLNNVIYTGDLSLSGGARVTFSNGSTFTGTTATVDNSTLFSYQNANFAGKNITVQNGGVLQYSGAATTANLGNVTLASGGRANIYGTLTNTLATLAAPTGGSFELLGGTILNGAIASGALTFTSSGGTLDGASYTGDLSLAGGARVTFANSATFTGTNALVDGTNSALWFNIQSGTMAGKSFTAQNGGAVVLTGSNTTAGLYGSTINAAGGHAYLNSTVDNSAATLTAPNSGIFELYGGTINGGTVAAGALTFTGVGGTLNGVAYSGDLTLPASTYAYLKGGTTFNGANLALANSATLYWQQTGTLAGRSLTFGDYSHIQILGANTFTLDSTTTATGAVNIDSNNAGAAIINQGTINHTSGSGLLEAGTVTNQGTINTSAGTSFSLGYYPNDTFINAPTGTINLAGSSASLGSSSFVNAGTLNIQTGTLSTNYNLVNTSTGTIKGSGIISGGLTMMGGHLAPGNSIGTLTLYSGNLDITAPTILDIELDATSADKLVFQYPNGIVDLGTDLLTLNLQLLGVPTMGSTYTILDATTGGQNLIGTFVGLPNSGDTLSALYSGTPYTFQVEYLTNSINLVAVPEPGTFALLGAGLVLLAFRRRFIRRRG